MVSSSYKRSHSIFTFLLSLFISVSVAICPCSPDFSSLDHQHAQSEKKHPCHQESNPEQDEAPHKNSNAGHACLCDGGSASGDLTQAEKTPPKTDFLVAILSQFQIRFAVAQPTYQPLRSTHSPPLAKQPLYITHLTLLI